MPKSKRGLKVLKLSLEGSYSNLQPNSTVWTHLSASCMPPPQWDLATPLKGFYQHSSQKIALLTPKQVIPNPERKANFLLGNGIASWVGKRLVHGNNAWQNSPSSIARSSYPKVPASPLTGWLPTDIIRLVCCAEKPQEFSWLWSLAVSYTHVHHH